MTNNKTITIGHSPDPDDAFMFYAMSHGKIDTHGYNFEEHLEGIDSLNKRALNKEFHISAVSLHQFPYIVSDYRIMPVGASMGDGYGPVLVSMGKDFDPNGSFAIPGDRTTAALYLKLRFGDGLDTHEEEFDAIEGLVKEGKYDFGMLIHEGQMTYEEQGFKLVEDMGAWWRDDTGGLPIPLGVNVVRRDVEDHELMTKMLREAISWGFDNEEEALEYSMKYARGLEKERVLEFVKMYVNDFTLDLGDRGRAAVKELMNRAKAKGYIPDFSESEF